MTRSVKQIAALLKARIHRKQLEAVKKYTTEKNRAFLLKETAKKEESVVKEVLDLLEDKVAMIKRLEKANKVKLSVEIQTTAYYTEKAKAIVTAHYAKLIRKNNLSFKVVKDLLSTTCYSDDSHEGQMIKKKAGRLDWSKNIEDEFERIYEFKTSFSTFFEGFAYCRREIVREVACFIAIFYGIYLIFKINEIYKVQRFIRYRADLLRNNVNRRIMSNKEESFEEMAEYYREIAYENPSLKVKYLSYSEDLKNREESAQKEIESKLASKLTTIASNWTKSVIPKAKGIRRGKSYFKGDVDVYTGKFHGFGKLIEYRSNQDFSVYEGIFKNGKKHGYGWEFKHHLKSVELYFGEFREGRAFGQGEEVICVFIAEDDWEIYSSKGKFAYILAEGTQQKFSLNKSIFEKKFYEGAMVGGRFHDKGGILKTFRYNKVKQYRRVDFDLIEESTYKGALKAGAMEGKGFLEATKNNQKTKYLGEFKQNKMHGDGKIEFANHFHLQSYEGSFFEDKYLYGYGRSVLKNGDVFEGFYSKNGQKCLIGTYSYFNPKTRQLEDRLFGSFYGDKKNGTAVYYGKDNSFLVGNYTDGEKNGLFHLVSLQKDQENRPVKAKKLLDFESNILLEKLNNVF